MLVAVPTAQQELSGASGDDVSEDAQQQGAAITVAVLARPA
jgi:hypothetical protein